MIKARVKKLKESIRSSLLREYIEMDELEASRLISSKASDEIATDDIVDEETGEICIEKGQPYGESILHPDETARRERYHDDRMAQFDDDDNLADFESSGVSAEDIAQDGVLSFFHEYPEWKKWSELLDMDKGLMKAILSDHVYDALLGSS
jgi:hypothetical protein